LMAVLSAGLAPFKMMTGPGVLWDGTSSYNYQVGTLKVLAGYTNTPPVVAITNLANGQTVCR